LIKEANDDAGLAAHPSGRWTMNCNHFQLAMLAYNLNCWLMLFNREENAKVETLKHTTLATARLRFLFLAAKIWRHAGRVGVSYSDHYEEQGIFCRLLERLRAITRNAVGPIGPLLADDLGWGDLTSFGCPDIQTPAIDALRRQGVRFTRAYSNAPECTPTRSALMTERYQQRVGGLECAIGVGNVDRYDEAE